jgi:hypothetical protein
LANILLGAIWGMCLVVIAVAAMAQGVAHRWEFLDPLSSAVPPCLFAAALAWIFRRHIRPLAVICVGVAIVGALASWMRLASLYQTRRNLETLASGGHVSIPDSYAPMGFEFNMLVLDYAGTFLYGMVAFVVYSFREPRCAVECERCAVIRANAGAKPGWVRIGFAIGGLVLVILLGVCLIANPDWLRQLYSKESP